ncbi:MAG TPA: hypothetical protein VHN79_02895 [Lacunisphaera sp.]|nr:hypothetical protein [Lacunisphaera sp.]HEX2877696.1 hypothetical protein [Polyangiaceae bacterium]
MRFIDDWFPLIATINAPLFDEHELKSMADGFERYFERGERYTLITVSPRNAPAPGPRERKMIAEWANHPRVRDFSKRLCVGSATVITNPVARAALTVITALWKPASPLEVVPSIAKGLDYCLRRVQEERLALPGPADLARYQLQRILEDGA